MTTLYLCQPAALHFGAPPGHPERADRIWVIERTLEQERFAALTREQAPAAEIETVALAHLKSYVEGIIKLGPRDSAIQIDADTTISPGTIEAALRGAGAAVKAVDEVMSGRVRNAFSASRPPGHHAERGRANGFCFFNNVAIAARHAQKKHGTERVAIVDWDAHHGNGTQDIFWSDRSVLFCSTHEMPLYPWTGAASECGVYGTIVNVPLAADDGGDVFRQALEANVLPRIADFRPDLILISAGFDAHWRDPLANLNLTEADFSWATRRIIDIADRVCDGRIVSLLEGGYDLEGIAKSVAAHVTALMRN